MVPRRSRPAPGPAEQREVGGDPTAGTPHAASGVLSGRATPGGLISIIDAGLVIGAVTAGAWGSWQFAPALAAGKHTIMADFTSSSGDTSLLSGAAAVSI